MALGIIGRKLGMTQMFDMQGRLIPVTVIQAGPCPVVQKKTQDKDGYSALQLGFGATGKKAKNNKPYSGHFKAAGVDPSQVLMEFRIENADDYEVGENISVDLFKTQENISVTGVSRGRGFTGVMKRHNFAGKDRGHGAHEAYRHGGSIGCRTPKRVDKGKKMPGRMGTQKCTVKNLMVMLVDKENNLILVKGAVPGWKNGLVAIKKSEG